MGTRGAYGYHIHGHDKIAYNQYDSYPEGLGTDILDYLNTYSMQQLHDIAEGIRLVDSNTIPTPEEIEKYREFFDANVSTGEPTEWYCLLRHTQGDLFVYHNTNLDIMEDSSSFLLDSLFCEWAYIINLDTNMLEVYKGFNKNKNAPGRYADIETSREFYGVSLLAEFPLDNLPTQDTFVELLTEKDEED